MIGLPIRRQLRVYRQPLAAAFASALWPVAPIAFNRSCVVVNHSDYREDLFDFAVGDR